MSNTVLIIGQSGTGKSTSLRTLNPATTFIINVLDKPLPFRGFKSQYKKIRSIYDTSGNKTGKTEGNYFSSYEWDKIIYTIETIDKTRPDIETLIIDDWQYILSYEFMDRVSQKGFDKFSEIAQHALKTINACINTRPTLTNFILSHSDVDNNGKSKCKTIGKLLDEKITIEGIFTTVLHSRMVEKEYVFQTQNDGEFLAKSPMGMFDAMFVPNDLLAVKHAVENYFNEEV